MSTTQLAPFVSDEPAILKYQYTSDQKTIQEDYPDFVRRSLAQLKQKENQKGQAPKFKESQQPRLLQQNYFSRVKNIDKQLALVQTKTSSTTDDCNSLFEKTSLSLTPDKAIKVEKKYKKAHYKGEEIIIFKHKKQIEDKNFQYLLQTLQQITAENTSDQGKPRNSRKQALRFEENYSSDRSRSVSQSTVSLIKLKSSIRCLFNQKESQNQFNHLSEIVKQQQVGPSFIQKQYKQEQKEEKKFQNKIFSDMITSRIISSRKSSVIIEEKQLQDYDKMTDCQNKSKINDKKKVSFFKHLKLKKKHLYQIILSVFVMILITMMN